MIGERLFARAQQGDRWFRWRGGEVSRLEGLTDAVFALALTLLVVTLDVPGTFSELAAAFSQIPVFAVCFAILIQIWYHHFLFHRRYGLEDGLTVFFNAALLFVLLLYVYPLKFVAVLVSEQIRGVRPVFPGPDGSLVPRIQSDEGGTLFLLFSGGYAVIFLLLALLHSRGRARRRALELDALELVVATGSIRGHLLTAAVALLSVAMVLAGVHPAWCGLVFFLLGPVHFVNGFSIGRRAERLAAEAEARGGNRG